MNAPMFQAFPVMWQGVLALKNENSYVQMHFIAGNRRLPNQALPQPMASGVLPPLRISQRMRLEHTQLEGVAKRMQVSQLSYLISSFNSVQKYQFLIIGKFFQIVLENNLFMIVFIFKDKLLPYFFFKFKKFF